MQYQESRDCGVPADRDPKELHVEKQTVVSPQAARAGVISGRVLLVLATSLILAFIAMAVLLPYFYGTDVVPR
jgi:hypothetical protein